MITIAICDDKQHELNTTIDMCSKYSLFYYENKINIVSFQSPGELNKYILQKKPMDILLLDIYMPGITGMELARDLRDNHNECQIIFISSSPTHAVEAFSVHAAHYLVKPITQKQLDDALNSAMKGIEKKRKSILLLKSSSGMHKIHLDNLLFAETEKHIQHIHMLHNKHFQVRITSKELFDMISYDQRFFKCGSTYIFNLDKVEEINARNIIFEGGIQLPMLRRQYKELLDRYTGYMLEGK